MYVQSTGACDLPNSASPITARQIADQNARVERIGRHFTSGNDDMAEIVRALTPPAPVGDCGAFTSSLSMVNLSPFPFPAPGPAVRPGSPSSAGGVVTTGERGPSFRRLAYNQMTPPAPASSSSGPPGSIWTVPGGGSTYPWASLQRQASDMIPAWSWNCGAAASPNLAIGPGGGVSPKLLWGVLAAVVGLAFVTRERGRRR